MDDDEYRRHVRAVAAAAPPLSSSQLAFLRRIMRRTLMPMNEQEEPTVRTIHPDGSEHDEVLRTTSGKIITEADIEKWAAEAEEGYEFHPFRPETGASTYKPSEGPLCADCGRPARVHKTLRPRTRRTPDATS